MSPSPSARPDEHLDKIMPLFTCSKPLPYVAYRTPSSCLGLFVSLYGGVGNMATAFQSEGYHGLLIDSAWNQQNNINCIGVQEEISQVLANHQLPTKFVGMDLPCESWTRARGGGGGPPRIRSREFIFGLPYVRPCDQTKLDLGNAQYEHAMCTIRKCQASGIAAMPKIQIPLFCGTRLASKSSKMKASAFFLGQTFANLAQSIRNPQNYLCGVSTKHISNFPSVRGDVDVAR